MQVGGSVKIFFPGRNGKLGPVLKRLDGYSLEQYGSKDHSRSINRILQSVVVTVCSNTCAFILIRHVVLKGSSQWIDGQNVTNKSHILYS